MNNKISLRGQEFKRFNHAAEKYINTLDWNRCLNEQADIKLMVYAQKFDKNKLNSLLSEMNTNLTKEHLYCAYYGIGRHLVSFYGYEEAIADKHPIKSNAENDILKYIEEYTIKQYGDLPHDQASTWTVEDCIKKIEKYVNRMGKNMRGEDDAKRDLLKIAHYCAMLWGKLQVGSNEQEIYNKN